MQSNLAVTIQKIGDVQLEQGNLVDALKSYREDLAIADRLALSDAGNAGAQRDLAISYMKLGDAQGGPKRFGRYAALLHGDSIAISDRLAKSDPSNADWQSDLVQINRQIGAEQQAQGDLTGALMSYQNMRDIIARLAQSDPSGPAFQRTLSVSDILIGGVQMALARACRRGKVL